MTLPLNIDPRWRKLPTKDLEALRDNIEKLRDRCDVSIAAMDDELEARWVADNDPRAARAYGLLREGDPR